MSLQHIFFCRYFSERMNFSIQTAVVNFFYSLSKRKKTNAIHQPICLELSKSHWDYSWVVHIPLWKHSKASVEICVFVKKKYCSKYMYHKLKYDFFFKFSELISFYFDKFSGHRIFCLVEVSQNYVRKKVLYSIFPMLTFEFGLLKCKLHLQHQENLGKFSNLADGTAWISWGKQAVMMTESSLDNSGKCFRKWYEALVALLWTRKIQFPQRHGKSIFVHV